MRYYHNEHVDSYRKQEKTAWIAFISEFPNLVVSVIAAFFAGSPICWADCAGSLESTSHCLFIALVSGKMKREKGDHYNYGMDRLEVFVSFLCDTLAIVSMLLVMATSIYGLFVPRQPEDSLMWFLIIKGSNISFDTFFLINQIKIYHQHPCKMSETELKKSIYNLSSDSLVGIAGLLSFIFRRSAWVMYFGPIFTIIMTVFFIFGFAKHVRRCIIELSDVALPSSKQDIVVDIILKYRNKIERIESVNSHELNERPYIDIELSFTDETTYKEQKVLLDDLTVDIMKAVPDANIRLIIDTYSSKENTL